MMEQGGATSWTGRLQHLGLVAVGAALFTMAFFLVLPLIQAITEDPDADLRLQQVDTAYIPPPDDVAEEEPEEEPEPEDEPPEMLEELPPLDLSQLEMVMSADFGAGWMGADLTIELASFGPGAGGSEELFSLSDLDQKPRAIHQASPVLDARLRQKTPGKVVIVFEVSPSGQVENPRVQSSTDPAFEKPAMKAIQKWKFEPGRRNGEPVRFKMRVPVSFPKA